MRREELHTEDAVTADTIPDGHYCPNCGYDQRGLSSDRCPECGLAVDRETSNFILWERRREVGYVSSFLRTLMMATFAPMRLARSTGSPVDVRSAKLFRWTVLAMAAAPMLVFFALVVWKQKGATFLNLFDRPDQGLLEKRDEPLVIWSAGATLVPVMPAALFLTLAMATGISHWFYTRSAQPTRQNRAMALSYYLCAPLAWVFLPMLPPALLFCFLHTIEDLSPAAREFGSAAPMFTCITAALIALALLNNLRAISRATLCGTGSSLLRAAGIMVQVALSIATGLVLFPAVVGFCWLMIDSLRK